MNLINKNNMSEKLKDKIIGETVDTIIDSIEDKLVDYMFDYGKYEETNDEFFNDKEEMFGQVIKELNNRINNNK
tara:strand:- start:8 stop:229 length:222 start_codon:yes stop_codon:yes gene_type:complete